jgi:hypothetical protein
MQIAINTTPPKSRYTSCTASEKGVRDNDRHGVWTENGMARRQWRRKGSIWRLRRAIGFKDKGSRQPMTSSKGRYLFV